MKRVIGTMILLGLLAGMTGTSWAAVKLGVGAGECYGGLGLKGAYVFRLGHSAESSTGELFAGLGTGEVPGIVLQPVLGIKGHFVGSRGAYASLSVGAFRYGSGRSVGYVVKHGLLETNIMGGYDFPLNKARTVFFSPAMGFNLERVETTPYYSKHTVAHFIMNLGFDFKL